MNIREATPNDFEKIWPIFHEIISAGETYAYETDTEKEQAFTIWMQIMEFMVSNAMLVWLYFHGILNVWALSFVNKSRKKNNENEVAIKKQLEIKKGNHLIIS